MAGGAVVAGPGDAGAVGQSETGLEVGADANGSEGDRVWVYLGTTRWHGWRWASVNHTSGYQRIPYQTCRVVSDACIA